MPLCYRIVTLQVAATLAVAAGLAWWSAQQAAAALAAGVVCILPNGYFAWRVNHERSAGRLLASGVARFVGTVGLMALAFATMAPAPLGFFGTFGVLQVAHVVGAAGIWGSQP